MSPRTSRILRIGVSAVLLVLVLSFANWGQVWHVLSHVEPKWIAVTLALAMLDRLCTNQRWKVLLDARGVHVGFLRLFRVQLGANFLGSFLPSSIGVDAIRMTTLCRAGESPPAVIAATLVDRISLALATMFLGAAMLLLFAQSFVPPVVTHAVIIATAAVLVMGAFCLRKSVRSWVRLKVLPRAPQRFRQTLHEIADAALTYRHEYRAQAEVMLFTLLTFAIRIFFVQAEAFAVGLHPEIWKLMMVLPILWIIVMLPITIGGIGVQDAGYVALMAFIGIPAPLAVSMSLIEHVTTRLASLPGMLFIGDVAAKRANAVREPVGDAIG